MNSSWQVESFNAGHPNGNENSGSNWYETSTSSSVAGGGRGTSSAGYGGGLSSSDFGASTSAGFGSNPGGHGNTKKSKQAAQRADNLRKRWEEPYNVNGSNPQNTNPSNVTRKFHNRNQNSNSNRPSPQESNGGGSSLNTTMLTDGETNIADQAFLAGDDEETDDNGDRDGRNTKPEGIQTPGIKTLFAQNPLTRAGGGALKYSKKGRRSLGALGVMGGGDLQTKVMSPVEIVDQNNPNGFQDQQMILTQHSSNYNTSTYSSSLGKSSSACVFGTASKPSSPNETDYRNPYIDPEPHPSSPQALQNELEEHELRVQNQHKYKPYNLNPKLNPYARKKQELEMRREAVMRETGGKFGSLQEREARVKEQLVRDGLEPVPGKHPQGSLKGHSPRGESRGSRGASREVGSRERTGSREVVGSREASANSPRRVGTMPLPTTSPSRLGRRKSQSPSKQRLGSSPGKKNLSPGKARISGNQNNKAVEPISQSHGTTYLFDERNNQDKKQTGNNKARKYSYDRSLYEDRPLFDQSLREDFNEEKNRRVPLLQVRNKDGESERKFLMNTYKKNWEENLSKQKTRAPHCGTDYVSSRGPQDINSSGNSGNENRGNDVNIDQKLLNDNVTIEDAISGAVSNLPKIGISHGSDRGVHVNDRGQIQPKLITGPSPGGESGDGDDQAGVSVPPLPKLQGGKKTVQEERRRSKGKLTGLNNTNNASQYAEQVQNLQQQHQHNVNMQQTQKIKPLVQVDATSPDEERNRHSSTRAYRERNNFRNNNFLGVVEDGEKNNNGVNNGQNGGMHNNNMHSTSTDPLAGNSSVLADSLHSQNNSAILQGGSSCDFSFKGDSLEDGPRMHSETSRDYGERTDLYSYSATDSVPGNIPGNNMPGRSSNNIPGASPMHNATVLSAIQGTPSDGGFLRMENSVEGRSERRVMPVGNNTQTTVPLNNVYTASPKGHMALASPIHSTQGQSSSHVPFQEMGGGSQSEGNQGHNTSQTFFGPGSPTSPNSQYNSSQYYLTQADQGPLSANQNPTQNLTPSSPTYHGQQHLSQQEAFGHKKGLDAEPMIMPSVSGHPVIRKDQNRDQNGGGGSKTPSPTAKTLGSGLVSNFNPVLPGGSI